MKLATYSPSRTPKPLAELMPAPPAPQPAPAPPPAPAPVVDLSPVMAAIAAAAAHKPVAWRFTVHRDRNGRMTHIDATPQEGTAS